MNEKERENLANWMFFVLSAWVDHEEAIDLSYARAVTIQEIRNEFKPLQIEELH